MTKIDLTPKEVDYETKEEWFEAFKEYCGEVFAKDPIKALEVLFGETA